MLGVGFIGTGSAHHRGRAGENGAKSITATVLPASSPLVVGETLADTVDWAVQYSTDEGGQLAQALQQMGAGGSQHHGCKRWDSHSSG